MMKMRWLIGVSVVLISFGLTGLAFASQSYDEDKSRWKTKFSPGTLENDGSWTGALDYKINYKRTIFREAKYQDKDKTKLTEFRKSFDAYAASEGAIAVDADLNTKPIKAEAKISYAINLYKARIVKPGSRPKEFKVISKGFDLGRADFSLSGGYETDQQLDNRNYTVSSEAALIQTLHNGLRGLIPSVFLGYDLIRVDKSQSQDERGLDDDSAQRFRAFAQWKLNIGSWISEPLDPLALHLDLRYYKTEGLPDELDNIGEDEAAYVAGTLTYSFTQKEPLGIINAVFLRLDNGRIPPVTKNASRITVGITMFEN